MRPKKFQARTDRETFIFPVQSAEHEQDREQLEYVCNVCIYVCIVITYSKSNDQLGKVVNPALGQLNRENEYFPVRVHA